MTAANDNLSRAIQAGLEAVRNMARQLHSTAQDSDEAGEPVGV